MPQQAPNQCDFESKAVIDSSSCRPELIITVLDNGTGINRRLRAPEHAFRPGRSFIRHYGLVHATGDLQYLAYGHSTPVY